jgi:hypothetical protein
VVGDKMDGWVEEQVHGELSKDPAVRVCCGWEEGGG